MGARKRPEGEELVARIRAWGDEWRAAAGCTAPADRPRAEAAIAALYAADRRPEPTFAWVPSPAAGILAYDFASQGRGAIGSRWARGDIGSGLNREFNALADPFGMEPAWTLRLATAVRDRIPSSRPRRGPGTRAFNEDPAVTASEALGFGGTAWLLPLVRAVAVDRGTWVDPERGRADAAWVARESGRGDRAAVDLAAGVLGEAWARLVATFGLDLARGLYAEATRRLVAAVLAPPTGHGRALQAMQPGQWDLRAPVLAAARDVLGSPVWRHAAGRAEHEAQIDARLEIARSAGPWWALEGLAIVSERPVVIRRDDRGRPHCADGPAIAWPDGLEAFAWHGVGVAPWVIREPGRITIEAIDGERNVEVRRVLVERFGAERLVREGGAILVDEDATGRLWRREPPGSSWSWPRQDPVVMVEVANSTPEPDGSRKAYFLRVPPTTRSARQAVAWTFGLGAVEYRPAVES